MGSNNIENDQIHQKDKWIIKKHVYDIPVLNQDLRLVSPKNKN